MIKLCSRLIFPFTISGILLLFSTGCNKDISDEDILPGDNDSVYETVVDIDNNVYRIVQIGAQTWFAENLKTTRFIDGKDIPGSLSEVDWGNMTSPAYCWYLNNQYYDTIYGALYNWYAVETGNLCPTGWHVPSDSEWTSLIDFLGDSADVSGKLKETGTTHWNYSNTGVTNESGFTALPGGFYVEPNLFLAEGNFGFWWTSNETDENSAWCRSLNGNLTTVDGYSFKKGNGLSVRCIKNNLPILDSIYKIFDLTNHSVTIEGNLSSNGGDVQTQSGVCWSTSVQPTINNNVLSDVFGKGDFTINITDLIANTTYYVRAFATNTEGTVYSNEFSFKTFYGQMQDRNLNVYNTIKIGDQEWMAENLRIDLFHNNEILPMIPQLDFRYPENDYTSGYWCFYDYKPENSLIYGMLYRWTGFQDDRSVSPAGWHVPSDAEWAILIDYSGGIDTAGDLLKEAGSDHWVSYIRSTVTNESRFTALPGGYFYGINFYFLNHYGYWWSATESDSSNAWCYAMTSLSGGIGRVSMPKDAACSVRLVKD